MFSPAFCTANPIAWQVGLGTDEASVRYLLQENAFGTRRVAVVRDIFDRDMKRRHLDSVVKIVDRDCVLALDSILGADNLRRWVGWVAGSLPNLLRPQSPN